MAYVKTNWVDNTTPIDKNNLNKIESGIKNNDINIGEENYDNTKTYEVGDIVRYNEKIYKCITAITTAENFDISKWEQTNIVEIVQSEKSKIYELIEAISTPIVGEGENITLNDTAEKRFEKFDIEGNSEQETRSGKNLYKASSIWYKNINGINITVSDRTENSCVLTSSERAYTSFASGQPGGSSEYRTKVEPNTEYTLSINAELLNGTSGIGLYVFFDKDSSSDYFNLKSIDYSKKITFTTPADTNYIHFRIDIYNASTSYKISNIQIEKGSKATSYEPYGAMPSTDYPSEIKTVGSNVNLFDESKAITSTKNGMTLSYSEKGLVLNGTTTAVTDFWINDLEIDLESDNYTLSSNVSLKDKGMYVLNDENGKYIFQGDFNSAQTVKLTSKKCAKYFLIQIAKGVTFNNQRLKIKLEKGTVATPWSPYDQGCINVIIDNGLETTDANYKSQIYTIPVQQEMLEGDYFDFDNEEEVHIWNKLVLDGTEDGWLKREVASEEYRFELPLSVVALNNNQTINILCDKLKGLTADATYVKQEGISASTWVQIYLKEFSRDKTVEDFKNWLKEHPLTIYYKLATPERLKFTNEQKEVAIKLNNARTYKGVTHIYSNDAVSPNCYVEAVKDLTTLIQ